jgi:HSP20 family protein
VFVTIALNVVANIFNEGGFMSLIRWEPFREMDDFLRQVSPMFGRNGGRTPSERTDWAPTANISETDKEYLIKAELPEVRKEDVKILLENGVITISGERKQQKEAKDENEIRVESFYGSFTRSFSLPDNVDPNGVRAESKDGVLKIHIPKKEVSKPKQISVQVQ